MWRALLFSAGMMIGMVRQDVAPSHDLTARDMVETLADFEIKHVDQQPFYRKAYGVTNFESDPPAIWIFNTGTTADRRATVIHELLHVYYHDQHMDPPEEFIAAEEVRLYRKWSIE